MKLPWRLDKAQREARNPGLHAEAYDSVAMVESRVMPGVTFAIARMSFERRLDLMRRIRDLGRRGDFLEAGQAPEDKMDAALVRAEIERVYVAWGVRAVTGLVVDGRDAGPEALLQSAPEGLFQEALAAVRAETGLNEDERKNS